jgi:hypothetical protein
LHALSRHWDDAFAAFMRLGVTQDTATHPGTRKRIASLRAAGIKLPAASEPSQTEQR